MQILYFLSFFAAALELSSEQGTKYVRKKGKSTIKILKQEKMSANLHFSFDWM